jgi:chromate reductase, NAD(P)H dehydrogenase (quinone)
MTNKATILGICGSTRKASGNLNLLKAISSLLPEEASMEIYTAIDQLPHFNPDLDVSPAPDEIVRFRTLLHRADAVIICTPEYAMGVPGTLKNALDWTVKSADFSGKPSLLITASTLGEKAHESLLATLKVIEADIDENTALLISHIRSKLGPDGLISDANTLKAVNHVLQHLLKKISAQPA